jgi:hypothetical protein
VRRALFSLLLAGLLSMSVMGVLAANTTTTVGESDITRQAENTPPTDNWVLYTRATTPGTGTFETGPTGSVNTGSLRLTTTLGSDKVFLYNFDYDGTALANIDEMSYSTYRHSGTGSQVTSVNIVIDENGPSGIGGFATLVFEPVYNLDQDPVASNIWQTWDAYNAGNAIWWSTKNIPGVCAFNCFVTWSSIVANNPDATILGAFGLNQGGGNPGLDTSVDALKIGVSGNSTTYDFEVLLSPQSKDDCKNGGWQTFNNPAFGNQGDCVNWVNHS